MKHLKLFFALFAMLALGVGNAWAETSSITFSEKYDANTKVDDTPIAITEGITATFTKGTSTATQYYESGSAIRWYGGGGLNITSTIGNITAITITYTQTANSVSTDVGSYTLNSKTGSWSGNASSIQFTQDGTSGHCRISTIEVTYTPSAVGEDPGTGGETPEPDPEEPETPGTGGSETIVIKYNSTFAPALPTASSSVNTTATAHTAEGLSFKEKGIYKGSSNNYLMFTQNKGFLYNTQSLGTITSVSVTYTSVTSTSGRAGVYFGTTEQSTYTTTSNQTIKGQSQTDTWTNTTEGNGFFQLSTSNKNVQITQIEITYTSGGSTEPTPSVTLDPSSKDFGTVNVGETLSQEFTITTENTTATLTASIDNTTDYAVSAIAGDKVTVTYQPQSAGTHPAVLTVKAGEEATATVNLTGKAVQALEGTWILVTDASSLKAGDEIIIAAKEYDVALSTTQANNNRPEVAITKNGNTITATSETQVLTLQAGTEEGTLALYTGDGYLYAASSSSNYLRTENTLSENSSWTISIADGTATLTAQGTYTRNTIFYNQSSKLFACYASTTTNQKAITLYKKTNGQQLAGLAYETTKYLTKLGETFATPVLANPNAVDVTYESSDNNVATVAADGAVTINAAGIATITASFAGNSSFLEGSAKYTICVTEHAGTQADPYSVADARRVIDVMETAEGVYATGIVSEIVTAYNSEYGNITYNISVDGTTTGHQLQAYRGFSYDGDWFTSDDDIKVGDEVVVKGNLKKHNTTYEFDAGNQLVSLNRTKEQAGLAYAETEHNANVGEDFAEPALTNPNNLTVTYSSSNTTLATVNATTGEVTILAAGKVTITASTAGDATYAAGSASYNITITDPSLAVATLPFYFDGKRADIEGTAGMTQSNLGTDYADAPYLKFNAQGAWAIVQFDSEPGEFSFLLEQNGESIGTFTVYESENGEDYTPIWSGGDLGGDKESATIEPTLSPTARLVKFEYTTKPTGTNYGLGEISIKKADHRQEADLAWNPATVSLTVGDAFTAPTFSNPNTLEVSFESSNTELATVDNAGVISLVSGKTGTATITATFADGDATYKPAEATCVITVSPKSEKVVILAQYDGKWYALKADKVDENTIAALEVTYFEGKLYNVDDADKALIEWDRAVVDGNATFKNGENYLSAVNSANLTLSANACDWVYEGGIYKIESSDRTFLYRAAANGFKNYDKDNAGTDDYSSLPVVTAPVYATGDIVYTRTVTNKYGTICLPYASASTSGAIFYRVAGKETGKVYLESVDALEAGVPYIFEKTANTITVTCQGEAVAEAASANGLIGTFEEITVPNNAYILSGGAFCTNNDETKPNKINAYRAYLDLSAVTGGAPQQMPGRRYIGMSVQGENGTTGLDNIMTTEAPAKVIVNGQLIIIRDGVKYNVQGQKL